MLYLLFQLDQDRYALQASRVIEIIPLLNLKPLPQAPKGIAGMIIYRGHPLPVLDLTQIRCGRPARQHLSTRIIIIQTRPQPVGEETGDNNAKPEKPSTPTSNYAPAEGWIGLIAEHATETIRRNPHDFVPAGLGPLGPDGGTGQEKLGVRNAECGMRNPNPPHSALRIPNSQVPALLLDKVLVDSRGVIQLLNPQNLLGENLRDLTNIKWHTAPDAPTENQTELFKI